jgi:catechol 2,3-dioxygenase-like lactoylglutathione lyase family enzyme
VVLSSPLIGVRDVPASSDWYQRLLGCESDMERGHPHRQEFDRITDANGKVLISFHSWDSNPETPMDSYLSDPDAAPNGRGVIVGFVVDDFEKAVERARELGASFIGDITVYPDRSSGLMLRDPDGYAVSLGSGRPASD